MMAEQEGPRLIRWVPGRVVRPATAQHTTNGQPAPAGRGIKGHDLQISEEADQMAGVAMDGLNEVSALLRRRQMSQPEFMQRCFLGGLKLALTELQRQQAEHGRRVLTPEELRQLGVRLPWD